MSEQTYTVTQVDPETREWSSSYGKMVAYTVDLKDSAGQTTVGVQWSRKPDSPAPAVGQELFGRIEDAGQYGWKFKASSPRGGGGGTTQYKADPAKQAAISMQAAHNTALAMIGHTQTFAGLDLLLATPEQKRAVLALVDALADHFYQRATKAGESAGG